MGRGVANGLVATATMTGVLAAGERAAGLREPTPRAVVAGATGAAGIDPHEHDTAVDVATTVGHFAYGGAAGLLFELIADHIPGPRSMRGPMFGLALLAVSYQGWVPAIGALPPLTEQRPGRRWTLVASHLAFGATLQARHRERA